MLQNEDCPPHDCILWESLSSPHPNGSTSRVPTTSPPPFSCIKPPPPPPLSAPPPPGAPAQWDLGFATAAALDEARQGPQTTSYTRAYVVGTGASAGRRRVAAPPPEPSFFSAGRIDGWQLLKEPSRCRSGAPSSSFFSMGCHPPSLTTATVFLPRRGRSKRPAAFFTGEAAVPLRLEQGRLSFPQLCNLLWLRRRCMLPRLLTQRRRWSWDETKSESMSCGLGHTTCRGSPAAVRRPLGGSGGGGSAATREATTSLMWGGMR